MGTPNTTPKKTEATSGTWLSSLQFFSDEFVFDKVSGMFYRLSPSAGFLLRSLDKETKVEHLVDRIQQQYRIDRLKAVRDVELFLNDLAAMGLVNPADLQSPAQEKT